MLDEIDKVGSDWRGDPSSALLEVLDPEQNKEFRDNYLDIPFDLSRVTFIATANTVDSIPPPLLDRMEVLQLPGYTEDEKVMIARRYLVPKQREANGLTDRDIEVTEAALHEVVRGYTREAGVRNLERQIATLCRKVARELSEQAKSAPAAGSAAEDGAPVEPMKVSANGDGLDISTAGTDAGKPTHSEDGDHMPAAPVIIDEANVHRLLGRETFHNEQAERIDRPGVATGLVWTPVGGDIIFIEAARMPGREEQLILTGQLGDVMKESAQAALTCVRSDSMLLKIDPALWANSAIHIHVPAGAVPKDGPSAGVTMAMALASLMTGRTVRHDVAMTGEITLRGKVLPVGGIKEKMLGAHRAGIRTVLIPERNTADLEDLPQELRDEMTFIPVSEIGQAFELALAEQAVPSEIAALPIPA
jgi:ATP-dependent Lon protease